MLSDMSQLCTGVGSGSSPATTTDSSPTATAGSGASSASTPKPTKNVAAMGNVPVGEMLVIVGVVVAYL